MKSAFGTIEKIEIRSVWGSEPNDFTPWLAEPENIALLGEAVGLDLEVEAQEKRFGPYRADIVCKEGRSGWQVVIENQLGPSDHGHLGQLISYAVCSEAPVIIWVAPSFCDEHRKAVDWLNRTDGIAHRFYAVQLEVLSISGSLPAPKFRLLAGPSIRKQADLRLTQNIEAKRSDSARRRLEYWRQFLSQLNLADPNMRIPKANSLGNLRFSLKGRDLWITVYAATSLGRIGVFVRGSAEYYERLVKSRRAIVSQLAASLVWRGDSQDWTVGVARRANPADRTGWPAQHRWLSKRLDEFICALQSVR